MATTIYFFDLVTVETEHLKTFREAEFVHVLDYVSSGCPPLLSAVVGDMIQCQGASIVVSTVGTARFAVGVMT